MCTELEQNKKTQNCEVSLSNTNGLCCVTANRATEAMHTQLSVLVDSMLSHIPKV